MALGAPSTPACAGLTRSSSARSSPTPLYPRVRGADDENRDYLEKDVPLPPRARG